MVEEVEEFDAGSSEIGGFVDKRFDVESPGFDGGDVAVHGDSEFHLAIVLVEELFVELNEIATGRFGGEEERIGEESKSGSEDGGGADDSGEFESAVDGGEIGLEDGIVIDEGAFYNLPVVKGTDDAIDGQGDGEDGEVGLEGGGEDRPFAEESGGGWNANERDEAEEEDSGGVRGFFPHSVEVLVAGSFFAVSGGDGDHGECADGHGGVADEVEDDVTKADEVWPFDVGKEGDEDISGVGDAGVSEDSFDIALGKGGDVADGHCCDGDEGEGGEPDRLESAGGIKQSGESGESSGFADDAHERRDIGGGALVDVGRPLMERDKGSFESETDKHKGKSKGGHVAGGASGVSDFEGVQIDTSGGSVEVGDSIEEESGGEGSEEEVFEGGFF